LRGGGISCAGCKSPNASLILHFIVGVSLTMSLFATISNTKPEGVRATSRASLKITSENLDLASM
jgi:hypothetical protein